MSDQKKPLLIGESNPYGADPAFALYPAPDGCSGWRLATVILGMTRAAYLESFERVNLVAGKWSNAAARDAAAQIWGQPNQRLVLCGSKVCAAFGLPFVPFSTESKWGCAVLVLPHPSGLCRLWGVPGNIERARQCMYALAPELAGKIGSPPPAVPPG